MLYVTYTEKACSQRPKAFKHIRSLGDKDVLKVGDFGLVAGNFGSPGSVRVAFQTSAIRKKCICVL